jgi:hypothetical protein
MKRDFDQRWTKQEAEKRGRGKKRGEWSEIYVDGDRTG